MPPSPATLGRALLASILLHALLIAAVTRLLPALRAPAPEVQAPELRVQVRPAEIAPRPPETEAVKPIAPRLSLPKEAQANASAARPLLAAPSATPPAEGTPKVLAGEAARAALAQLARALYYPREAVEQGLEGQAMVLLFLDESGHVIAARLEASSGHALLDDAAVRAARTLRGLPAGAPREALLPVRFRLR